MQNNIQFLLANNKSLQHYLSQVKATELLTLAEKQALGRRIMAGDHKALIFYLRFVQITYDGYNMAEIAKEFNLPTGK